MRRLCILLAIVVIGAAAPARAWCEATCLAPAEAGDSHCPTPVPADGTTSIAANLADACPVLEDARPSVSVRLDVGVTLLDRYVSAAISRTRITASFTRAHRATTVFQRSTPLRI